MLTLLLPLLAQAAVEAPRTVNGFELGSAEDFATPGPASVCMEEMIISPREGETAHLSYSGIHNGSIRLILANGEYVDFLHGDAWADRRRAGQRPAIVKDGLRFYMFKEEPEVSYQVFARSDWADGQYRPVVNIGGTAIAGARSDRRVLDRMSLANGDEAHCDRKYGYGWDVILGDESFETTESE